MAKKSKKETKISKKEIAVAIFARLDSALSDYQAVIGEKKFINHLKKAAKSLAEDVAEISKKQKAKFEKEVKKAEHKKKTEKSSKKKAAKPVAKRTLKKNSAKEIVPAELEESVAHNEEPTSPENE